MFRSLKSLCEDKVFTLSQRKAYSEYVSDLLKKKGPPKEVALFCLHFVYTRYDLGGHSVGRSLRSTILEKVQEWLRNGSSDKAKQGLSILLAMYFDFEYINEKNWYDGPKLADISDASPYERIHLCAAAFALGLDEIPEVSDWPSDDVLAFIKEG